jgi:chromosome segregation ATPase
MGQEALKKMLHIKAFGHDLPQVNLLLDMRLDTIATILEMKNQEFQALEAAQARARTEENALLVEMENAFHVFNALEDQLHGLHREAARLREETAEMRALVF